MRWIHGVALVVLASCTYAYAQTPPVSKKPPQSQQQASDIAQIDERGTVHQPVAINILPTQEDRDKAGEYAEENKEKAALDKRLTDRTGDLATYTEALAVFTLLLVFVGVGQVGLFFWQLRLIKASLDDAKIAADAALIGAKAAKESADIAQESVASLRRTERAYVFISTNLSTPEINNVLGNVGSGQSHRPQIIVSVANHGKTPAIIKKISGGAKIGNPTDAPSYETPITWSEYAISQNTPESYPASPIKVDRAIDVQTAVDIRTGKTWLRFYVLVEYDDVFGGSHETRYYWYYNDTDKCVEPCYAADSPTMKYNGRT